jgi:hypothetical protein
MRVRKTHIPAKRASKKRVASNRGLLNLFSFCLFGSGFVDALTSLRGGVWRCLKETVLKELLRERKNPRFQERGAQETGNNKDQISKHCAAGRAVFRGIGGFLRSRPTESLRRVL